MAPSVCLLYGSDRSKKDLLPIQKFAFSLPIAIKDKQADPALSRVLWRERLYLVPLLAGNPPVLVDEPCQAPVLPSSGNGKAPPQKRQILFIEDQAEEILRLSESETTLKQEVTRLKEQLSQAKSRGDQLTQEVDDCRKEIEGKDGEIRGFQHVARSKTAS